MSDLHLALLLLAAVLLVVLFAYNKWQERRALREFDATLRAGVADPLLHPPTPAAPSSGTGRGRIEPRLGTLAPPLTSPEPPVETIESPPAALPQFAAGADWAEDPMLDCALELRCAHPVDGVSIIDAAAPLARLDLALPIHLVAWDAKSQQWVAPDRFAFYSELLVAVQLATRKYALNEIDASRFGAAVEQVALALDADVDPPEVPRMVAQAHELDELGVRFDVQIGVTLESTTGPWDNATIARAAQEAGLVARGPMHWTGSDDAGQVLFRLTTASLTADRLALELDVPRVSAAAEPFRALLDAAERLAAGLSARIVDDNGRPIDAAAVTAIEAQLANLYEQMRAAGIEPGSPRAARFYV
jgi:hypothetical protein